MRRFRREKQRRRGGYCDQPSVPHFPALHLHFVRPDFILLPKTESLPPLFLQTYTPYSLSTPASLTHFLTYSLYYSLTYSFLLFFILATTIEKLLRTLFNSATSPAHHGLDLYVAKQGTLKAFRDFVLCCTPATVPSTPFMPAPGF